MDLLQAFNEWFHSLSPDVRFLVFAAITAVPLMTLAGIWFWLDEKRKLERLWMRPPTMGGNQVKMPPLTIRPEGPGNPRLYRRS